ncbi:MAG: FAD:protein FMN transferase [Gammaproteobacteria bacterium]|nr:FAD:protein FMN transferase [Gammaproteobacteria bacterium]
MPFNLRLLLPIFVFTFLLSACQPAPKEYKQTLLVFGTLVNITIYDTDASKAAAMIKAISDDLNFMHEAWHPWKPGPLGRTNTLLAQTEWFSANPSVMPLITLGQQLWHDSDGLFNPAIGHLLGLWGYHQDDPPQGPPPSANEIKKWLSQNPRMSDIETKGIRVRSSNAAVKLDFGAMAKGLAVDRVIEQLKKNGIEHAIVNAGGDLKAIGRHGDRPWRIGIRHPRQDGSVLAAVEVNDSESVFTSGDYERFYTFEGKRYHHIIDPRTGYPAGQSTSVTVIHPQAAVADAAATALFVAGPEQWQDIALKMKLQYVMLVDKHGQVHITPAMAKRIDWLGNDVQLKISQP